MLLCMYMRVSHFSHVWLFANPWTVAHQAPLSKGILQAGILEWVAIPYSRGSSQPGIKPTSHELAGGFSVTEPPGKPYHHFTKGLLTAVPLPGTDCPAVKQVHQNPNNLKRQSKCWH